MNNFKYPVILTIAGSDCSGGAGIQADLKTFSALGCFGTSAITALTVQNTFGVTGIHAIPVSIVKEQILSVISDVKPLVIKIGMTHTPQVVIGISEVLRNYPEIPIVFDPVMKATDGSALASSDAVSILKQQLIPLTTLLTPNISEAKTLSGIDIKNVNDMKRASVLIKQLGCRSVLIKGGHLEGPDLYDCFLNEENEHHIFKSKAIKTMNTHGTGCTLSSAISCFIALGNNSYKAISKGKTYVHQAIEHGKEMKIGKGDGPLNHFFDPQRLTKI